MINLIIFKNLKKKINWIPVCFYVMHMDISIYLYIICSFILWIFIQEKDRMVISGNNGYVMCMKISLARYLLYCICMYVLVVAGLELDSHPDHKKGPDLRTLCWSINPSHKSLNLAILQHTTGDIKNLLISRRIAIL